VHILVFWCLPVADRFWWQIHFFNFFAGLIFDLKFASFSTTIPPFSNYSNNFADHHPA